MKGIEQFLMRRGTLADAVAVRELAARTFRETYLPYDDPGEIEAYIDEHFTLEAVRAWFDDADQVVSLACRGDQCVGYAQVARSPVPACVTDRGAIELRRLYLDREEIGRGQGAELLREGMAAAAAMGHVSMWLLVYEKNTRARAFYIRHGFVEVGTAVFMFGGIPYHDPVMEMALTPFTART